MLTPELLTHLATNRTEPVYDQQHDEVLKRTLADVMAGVELDDTDPVRGNPQQHYQAARETATAHPDITNRTDIRKLMYSPSLPLTLGTIFRLGPPFSTSPLLNLAYLKGLHGIHSGVSPPTHTRPADG